MLEQLLTWFSSGHQNGLKGLPTPESLLRNSLNAPSLKGPLYPKHLCRSPSLGLAHYHTDIYNAFADGPLARIPLPFCSTLPQYLACRNLCWKSCAKQTQCAVCIFSQYTSKSTKMYNWLSYMLEVSSEIRKTIQHTHAHKGYFPPPPSHVQNSFPNVATFSSLWQYL